MANPRKVFRSAGLKASFSVLAALALTSWLIGALMIDPWQFSAARAAQGDRIVSIGGAITEIIYAIGQQGRIAAVDATSLFPPSALKEKPNVGYFRALSAEGVLSMQPSLVLAIEGAGPPTALKSLTEAGIPLRLIPDAPTPAGVVEKIKSVGAAINAPAAAERIAEDTEARFKELESLRQRVSKPRSILFVLSLQNGKALVGGRETSADAIIRLAGGVNAAKPVEGYKPMTDEAIIAAAPDAIIMMQRDGNAPTEDVFALQSFAATPAAKSRTLIAMDGLYLLGFGPRAPDAARDLMAALYPELGLPRLCGNHGADEAPEHCRPAK